MAATELFLFIATAFGFTIIPGPNATLIAATSITHNTKRGLQCAFGVSFGIAIHLMIALLSTQWFLRVLMESVDWLLWMLTLAIIYLCVRFIFSFFRTNPKPNLSGAMSFSKGAGISLSNPKGIIFFAVFIPTFIDDSQPYLTQSLSLASIFWLVSLCGDMFYAVFAAKLSRIAHARALRKWIRKYKILAKLRFRGWLSRW